MVAVLGLAGLAVTLAPGITESKQEREQAEREERRRIRAEGDERIRREQRPLFVSGQPARSDLAARRGLVDEATATVLADARRRAAAGGLRGPVRRVECEPFPRSVSGIGAEDSAERRFGRYSCLAVTADFARSEASGGGSIGHPYRVRIDFRSGRYALCKVAGRPGEAQLERHFGPTVPRACGGGP